MAKWMKPVFISSLVLNLLLIVGFTLYKTWERRQIFNLAAMTSEAEAHFTQYVLSELESGDPMKIESLKERLRQHVNNSQEAASV